MRAWLEVEESIGSKRPGWKQGSQPTSREARLEVRELDWKQKSPIESRGAQREVREPDWKYGNPVGSWK